MWTQRLELLNKRPTGNLRQIAVTEYAKTAILTPNICHQPESYTLWLSAFIPHKYQVIRLDNILWYFSSSGPHIYEQSATVHWQYPPRPMKGCPWNCYHQPEMSLQYEVDRMININMLNGCLIPSSPFTPSKLYGCMQYSLMMSFSWGLQKVASTSVCVFLVKPWHKISCTYQIPSI